MFEKDVFIENHALGRTISCQQDPIYKGRVHIGELGFDEHQTGRHKSRVPTKIFTKENVEHTSFPIEWP